MRSEPQNIGFAFDVLTPKLSCLIFKTNVVERVNSGQISLVVTCTADYACHHFRIAAKKIEISERTEQFETNISI